MRTSLGKRAETTHSVSSPESQAFGVCKEVALSEVECASSRHLWQRRTNSLRKSRRLQGKSKAMDGPAVRPYHL